MKRKGRKELSLFQIKDPSLWKTMVSDRSSRKSKSAGTNF